MKKSLLFLLLAMPLFGQTPPALDNWLAPKTTASNTIVGWDTTDQHFVHFTIGSGLTYTRATGPPVTYTLTAASGGGLSSFTVGNLTPIFTASLGGSPTTAPALAFTLSTSAAHTFLGNNTGSTAAPAYVQPAFTDISGTIGTAQLGTGTANSTTFLRGDSTWAAPAGGGTVTASGGALTANAVVLGAGTTDTKVVAGLTGAANKLTVGTASSALGSIDFKNATGAGTITVQSAAGGAGATTLTLPGTTGTVALTSDLTSGYQPLDSDLTTIAGLTATTDNFMIGTASAWASRTPAQARTSLGIDANVQTFLVTPSSANLATAVTGDTGSGALVFATSPALVTPALGTPTSGSLGSCTGYLTSALSGNVAVSQLPANDKLRTISFTVDGGGSAISTGKVKGFFTCPFSGTITGWNIVADTGTITVKIWKHAAGAKPTSSDSLTSTGLALSSGTAVNSSTTTEFNTGTTTAVTADDIFACNVETVSGVTEVTITLEITIN